MQLKSGEQHWGSLAKFFHWTIVLLIILQGTVGLIMVDLPKKPSIIPVYTFHKSVGLTIFALAVLRLAWRALDPHPDKPAGTPHWQALGARSGHALLYILLFAVPLSGWWFDSVSALRPLYWFGLIEIPHLTDPDKAMKDFASQTHAVLFWLLVAVAVGHAAMAFIHQFVNRDGTLARMLPGRRGLASAPAAAISTTSSATPENTDAAQAEEILPQQPDPAAGAADSVEPDRDERDRT
jgi:cytochrome b561